MPNSQTKWGSWVVQTTNGNEYHCTLEDRLPGETRAEEEERVKTLLRLHDGLMFSLRFTGAIYVCRACAELN